MKPRGLHQGNDSPERRRPGPDPQFGEGMVGVYARVPPMARDALQELAEDLGIPLSHYIRELLLREVRWAGRGQAESSG